MRTRVKICGITNPQDAHEAIYCGADAIGLVFYPPSPRSVTIKQAEKIIGGLTPFVTVVGLFVFFVLWVTRSRLSLIGVLFAMVSLGATGLYMAVGALVDIGDSASLMRMGVPQGVLVAVGAVLLLLGFPLVLPLGGLLGIGKGKNSLGVTALVFSPIAFYLLAVLAYNLRRNPDEWVMWTCAVGGGILTVLLTSVVVHYSARRCAGPETERRALPVNWRTCIASLALGAGVIVAESVFF